MKRAPVLLSLVMVPLLAASAFADDAAPPAATPATDTARVHLVASRDVSLDRIVAAGFEHVCNAPCDVDVAVDGTYRITGSNIRPSHGFKIHAVPGDRVTLEVDPASQSTHESGRATMIGGGVVAGLGVAVLAYIGASALVCVDSGGAACPLPNSPGALAGLGLGGLGALAVGTVVALSGIAVSGQSTSVHESPLAVTPLPVARNDRWLRLPTWSEHRDAVPVPAVTAVPIFGATF